MEYREIFLTLLRKFDETKQPQSYLKDLVESTHLFLRMLERFCKGRKSLMVQVSNSDWLLTVLNSKAAQPQYACVLCTVNFLEGLRQVFKLPGIYFSFSFLHKINH